MRLSHRALTGFTVFALASLTAGLLVSWPDETSTTKATEDAPDDDPVAERYLHEELDLSVVMGTPEACEGFTLGALLAPEALAGLTFDRAALQPSAAHLTYRIHFADTDVDLGSYWYLLHHDGGYIHGYAIAGRTVEGAAPASADAIYFGRCGGPGAATFTSWVTQ